MKPSFYALAGTVLQLCHSPQALAQNPIAIGNGQARVVERGPHHARWSWTTEQVWPDGQKRTEEHSAIEVWSEFLAPPAPRIREQILRQETDPQVRQAMVMPDLVDQTLDFGSMQMGSGQAFSLGAPNPSPIPVAKNWVQINAPQGRAGTLELARVVWAARDHHLPCERILVSRRGPPPNSTQEK